MNKIFTKIILMFFVLTATAVAAYAQSIVVSGTVTDKSSKEPIPGVSVTVKGKTIGNATNDKGQFSFTTTEKAPFTIVVSYIGYTTVEREITANATNLTFELEAGVILGQEVVISASRTPERILESPVSIERINAATLKELPTPSFYDALANLKGVESSNQSLTFKSINARGFNANGNTRFNQYIDGMDNQAPGLNFSVGNIVGITELDIDNVELLPGASSALYGAGGINGTLLMTSKDPFRYQGVSFQYKTGMNHVNDNNISTQPYNQFDLRLAKSWNNKFGVKFAFSFLQAKDWQGNNQTNFDRVNNKIKGGTRSSDPGYDGINTYGDEVNANLQGVARAIQATQPAAAAGFNGLIGAGLNYTQIVGAVNGNPAYAALRPALPLLGVVYGLNKGLISGQVVSRTGYEESALVDYDTESLKTSTGFYYNFTNTIQASFQANWGTGTSVYTGTDRYSLRNFNIGQYKLELKGQDFFLRGYTTQERSGDSYISSILGSYINEKTSGSESTWFPTYTLTYAGARAQGATEEAANAAARAAADINRPQPGSADFESKKRTIQNTNIAATDFSKGIYGARFDDKTNLYHYEGMYNFTNALNNAVELQVGASSRLYQLRSGGTIFDDLNREININEYGAFVQVGKKITESFKLTVAGRYDKSTNFEGRFTPRITGVYTVAPNNNIRVSYQTGYRNPTTQNQYIDLTVGGGSQKLIGGLPESLNKYSLNNEARKGFTENSYRAYQASLAAGTPNPSLLQKYTFDAAGVKPESVQAYELGYKGLFGGKLLVDAYGYFNKYKSFITALNVYQLRTDVPGDKYTKFGVPVNAEGEVTSYGAALGLDYLVGKYNLSGNVSYNEIGDLPANYINDFNTPTVRYNLGLGNREIVKNVGFNVQYRWQGEFYWNSAFAAGTVPAFSTVDAQLNFKMPRVNSVIKIGGSNLLNKYYITSYGNPASGAIYYVSYTYNP
jgi:outer membrane receptor protein involved in Fe transport